MTKEERKVAEDYAKRKGLALSEAMKRTIFDKIEEEYDIALINMRLREYEKNPKTYSHKETKKFLEV